MRGREDAFKQVGPFKIDYSVSIADVILLVGLVFGGLQYIGAIESVAEANRSEIEHLKREDARLDNRITDTRDSIINRLDAISTKIDQIITREIYRGAPLYTPQSLGPIEDGE